MIPFWVVANFLMSFIEKDILSRFFNLTPEEQSLTCEFFSSEQAYYLFEIGLPIHAFKSFEKHVAILNSIAGFKKQVYVDANHFLIPELSFLVSEYCLL